MRTKAAARATKSAGKKATARSSPIRRAALKPIARTSRVKKLKTMAAKRASSRRPAALKRDLEKAVKNRRIAAPASSKRPAPPANLLRVAKRAPRPTAGIAQNPKPKVAAPAPNARPVVRPQVVAAKPPVVTAPPGCQHHWQIASPNGPTSIGTCKLCGEQKEFRNSIPGGGWEREASEARKARAAAARAQAMAAQAARPRA